MSAAKIAKQTSLRLPFFLGGVSTIDPLADGVLKRAGKTSTFQRHNGGRNFGPIWPCFRGKWGPHLGGAFICSRRVKRLLMNKPFKLSYCLTPLWDTRYWHSTAINLSSIGMAHTRIHTWTLYLYTCTKNTCMACEESCSMSMQCSNIAHRASR